MSGPPGEEAETKRLERREFERGHIDPDQEPVAPRPAATVVVARSAPGGMEVLLLRRPEESSFAAGAYVFPGGRIDPGDRDPDLIQRVDEGRADGQPEALAAAARELWEETALLLAEAGEALGFARRASARRALLEGRASFGGLARETDLRLPGRDVAYFARWITPAKLSRRYDTRFFLTAYPGGPVELTREHTDAEWLRPARALDRFASGELPLLFPTRKTLERLRGFPGPDSAISRLRAEDVEPARPRLLVREDGVVPVLPGDDGYEEAARGDRG